MQSLQSQLFVREQSADALQLQERAHALIPGGCHTYAKGDDQWPMNAPRFIARGEGCHIWDTDGNEYIEYGMGCRAVTLGHNFPRVVEAARRALDVGCNFSRSNPIEVECAELFLSLVDGADMVKFCKDGSSATTGAVKLARAFTGRDHVALCADHPFFSTADWFIGTTPIDAGIPQAIKDLSVTFRYNDLDSVKDMFEKNEGKIAALILEPAKYEDPQDNFLHEVQELCRVNGTVFVLDEMITGFRWHNGGGQKYYNIVPDLSTFGKAFGNGFSVSALAGKRELMELGGLHHEKERVFLLSTTHGAETHTLAAAIETMKTYIEEPVIETIWHRGERIKRGFETAIARHNMQDYVQVIGKPCAQVFVCRDPEGRPSQHYRSLFLQETIKRGLLMTSLINSYSHSEDDIDYTVARVDEALEIYAQAIERGTDDFLVGRPSNVVYRRYN